MATTIVTKSGSGAPTASDLVAGELAVDLTNKRLYTEDSGGTVLELGTNPSGNITFGDNGRAIFGAANTLQMYTSGTNSYIIESGTGNFEIRANDILLKASDNTETMARFNKDAEVTLAYNGATKFSTTATGIDVTGSVTADGFQTDTANTTTNLLARNSVNAAVYLQNGGTGDVLHVRSGNMAAGQGDLHLKVANNGDISFYEDTGTTPKLIWDASAEMLTTSGLTIGTGTASTSLKMLSGTADYFQIDSLGTVTNLIAGNSGSGGAEMAFYTASAGVEDEHLRIDSSGNLLVAKTVSVGATVGCELRAVGTGVFTATSDRSLQLRRLTTEGEVARFYKDTALVGTISVTAAATAYNTSSDQRLKENIVDAPSASDDIDAIQVRSFDWKADGEHQKYGMVAQELQLVAPEAVSGDADSEDMMGVDYSKLVPMMLKEIQSLRARINSLEAE